MLGASAAGLIFLLFRIHRQIGDAGERQKSLEQERDNLRNEAWRQMATLNSLYDWDIAAKLIHQTVPRVELDPYFTRGRLQELHDAFLWSSDFNHGKSIVFADSGQLNGNPFVVAQSLDHSMGTKVYKGSLQISWTEEVRKADGKWSTETQYQTLHASIEKPFPEYETRTFVIYGNEAAPDLSFSRGPSDLSALSDGFLHGFRKRRAIKKVEAKSRDLNDSFTVMANKEFDALFGAFDRDHEVQFRLLFTPLAQQEMLKLLKDKEVGYGDDFAFVKQRMVNIIEPKHLKKTDITGNPEQFQTFDLAQARRFFNQYHQDFFRSFYFGMAPLLAIPLYQQHRSHADIYKGLHAKQSCFWEHESIANYYGEQKFQHPDCTTRSILKTTASTNPDGSQLVRVSAFGYRGSERTTYVSVSGGDGHTHKVPVKWIEYTSVRRDSSLVIKERFEDEPQNGMHQDARFSDFVFRRSVFSKVLDG